MIDLNERCPICGSGSFHYYINGYGALVKRCAGCGHFVTTKSVTTNKTTITDYTQLTNTPLNKCPVCGGALAYDTDDEGRLKKYCTRCESNWIIEKNIDTMDKFNEAIKHDIDPIYSTIALTLPPQTLEIKCDSITLKQNDISICFCSEKDIKQFDSITINGTKFKRVEE